MNVGMHKHGPDAVSLAFGVLFLVVVAGWLFGRVVDVNLAHLGWVIGATLIIVGVLGLWSTLRPGRRQGR